MFGSDSVTRACLMTLDTKLIKSVVAEHVGREGQLYQQSKCLRAQQTATQLGCRSLVSSQTLGAQKMGYRNFSLVVDGERLPQDPFQSIARAIWCPV